MTFIEVELPVRTDLYCAVPDWRFNTRMISQNMKMSFHGPLTSQFLRPSPAASNVPGLHPLPVLLMVALLSLVSTQLQAALQFSEVSGAAGAAVAHGFGSAIDEIDKSESGGVAAGDYDNDGDIDLYVIAGTAHSNSLLRNNGNGQFVDVATFAGVGLSGSWSSGPVFADINGDGWQDLLVGSMQGGGYYVFINKQDGTFTDASGTSGITQGTNQNDISSGLGDVDNDGDLDLFIGHHSFNPPSLIRNHLWVNDGAGVFSAADISKGTNVFGSSDRTFSATFVDINKDHWQDILVSADVGGSTVFQNYGDGTFTDVTSSTINDQNGMGAAAADLDNDGDIDWFVSSINNQPDYMWGKTGNRLYINNGSGTFSETSATAGVRAGYWGWAACAADFDNDGWLDLFHVNGMYDVGAWTTNYVNDPSRLFINNHNGTFTESSAAASLVDTGQGRAIVCFDYDNDGDIDIFVFNAGGTSRLYKNTLPHNPGPGWLQVDVAVETPGKTIAGTLIEVVTGSLTQTRQITVGSNLMSQNPLRQHFGLGGAATIDQVKVTWPSGTQRILTNQSTNQILLVTPPPPAELPIFKNGFES